MATSTAPAPQTDLPAKNGFQRWVARNHFILRRLHSLSGIVPVGGFLLFHFYENGSIFYGPKAYDSMAVEARGIRYLELIEIALIFIPFLYHALYGLFIASYARNNTMSYNYGRNNLFMWQRFTGIVLVLFILYHIWSFRFTVFRSEHSDSNSVAYIVSQFPVFVFYIAGVMSAAFHLGNGIWTFLITWGITIGKRAQQISQYVTTTLSVLVSLAGIAIAIAFVVQAGGMSWWFR